MEFDGRDPGDSVSVRLLCALSVSLHPATLFWWAQDLKQASQWRRSIAAHDLAHHVRSSPHELGVVDRADPLLGHEYLRPRVAVGSPAIIVARSVRRE